MLLYRQGILLSHVNTFVGSAFIGVWALGAGLLIWHASFATDPVASAFAATILKETQY